MHSLNVLKPLSTYSNSNTYCTRTSSCTGKSITFDRKEATCCDGFAVKEEGVSGLASSKTSTLKTTGCTVGKTAT